MKKIDTKTLTKMAAVAAAYFIMNMSVAEFAYGPIQFRYAEVLNLLAFYNPVYIIAVSLGCFLTNIFSPMGLYDMIFGTFHTFISLYFMSKVKNIYVASIFPAIFSFIIGIEIALASGTFENFFVITSQIMLSEFLAVSILGVMIFKILEKNKYVRSNVLLQ